MSFLVLEYLENRLRVCEAMIAEATDAQSVAIFEATRLSLIEEIERVTAEEGSRHIAKPGSPATPPGRAGI
jgi:hypothetical protein